jgi:saccharopine dehydrogenase (NAD+, L-lysine-forming)
MKIGIIREGKTPPDERVPLSPEQCKQLLSTYPEVELVVQKSPIRAIKDSQYAALGIPLSDDLSDCDVLFGVKEVPIDQLIPNKTYFFFSHTIKEQPYNRKLLQAIIDKNICMVDYETLVGKGGRLIGFGRYAGIVGCYNGLLAYGLKSGRYTLQPAHHCESYTALKVELKKVDLPDDFKIVMTGLGRVGKGATEILNALHFRKVSAKEFTFRDFQEPVFTSLGVDDYNARRDGKPFTRKEFYSDPVDFISTFPRFLAIADLYVACHYWDAHSPFLFSREDLKKEGINTSVVADISCDIDGPVASTLRPSTIEAPLYGYDPLTESEVDFLSPNAIGVMAVDNLPCELPIDASEDFGNELLHKIMPHLLTGDTENIIQHATIARDGKLTERYGYLSDYLAGTSV